MFATPPASLGKKAFINTFGGVYEHSAWIAKQAWEQGLDSSHNTAQGLAKSHYFKMRTTNLF